MAEPANVAAVEEQISSAARTLGSAVLGREVNADEFEALTTILRAATEALKHGHGFVKRLASQVQEERTTENVEEFFEDVIKTD
ncbi:MAG: hypothetical protein P4L84_24740 [Isosphaeraceae bacterium]|nr:hypothetical protein [Isosphaeraceae bacterium]